MDWLSENYEAVIAIVGATLALAGLIAKLTPTPKDDKWVAALLRIFNMWPPKEEPPSA